MSRPCTVCASSNRATIDDALVSGRSMRDIAGQFALSRSAVARHRAHVSASLIVVREEHERLRTGSLMAEIERTYATARKLADACDRWLADPEDPERYDIGPRSEEVEVICQTAGEDGTPRTTRRRLADILAQLEGAGYPVVRVEMSHADPRELILKAGQSLTRQMQLVLSLYESLYGMEQVEIFQSAVLDVLREMAPEARERVLARIREKMPLRRVVEERT